MGNVIPYNILDKKGRLLIGAGSELNDAKREWLKKRLDWHIDGSSPFKLKDTKQYQSDYERALHRYSGLFNECIRTGGFPSSSLHNLAEFVAMFSQDAPLYATLGRTIGLDFYTQAHSLNVAVICAMLSRSLNLPQPERLELVAAGLLHDIGKTKVPKRILLAQRKLSPHEFTVVQSHTELGAKIIGNAYSINIAAAVKYHHVRIGKGYPKDVDYKSLPDLVKWIGTADVYEAVTADRPYRNKMDPYKAIRILFEEGIISADFQIVRTFSEFFAKMYIGSVVTLSSGTFGVIKGVSGRNGIYTPVIEMIDGNVLDPSDGVEIRNVVGISEA